MKCLPHLASTCVVGRYLLVCYTIIKACANDVAADFGNALSPEFPQPTHRVWLSAHRLLRHRRGSWPWRCSRPALLELSHTHL